MHKIKYNAMKKVGFLLIISSMMALVDADGITEPSSISPPYSWSTSLTNDPYYFGDIKAEPLLSSKCSRSGSPTFNFGFIGNYTQTVKIYTPAIFFLSDEGVDVIWHADVDPRITEAATKLDLVSNGGLVLRDKDGHSLWSTRISGDSTRSLNLTCHGNLAIFGDNDEIIWQSFDHPTDTWLSGQSLSFGSILRSKVSTYNLSTGNYYLSITRNEAGAYFVYATNHSIEYGYLYTDRFNFIFIDSWAFMDNLNWNGSKITYNGSGDNITYLRLGADGHLNLYKHISNDSYIYSVNTFSPSSSTLLVDGDNCGYPTTCGHYGICFKGDQCRCPEADNEKYFNPIDENQPKLGCSLISPLTCKEDELKFIELVNVTSFTFDTSLVNVGIETCKKRCLQNCSCKAAIFRHQGNMSSGNCSLQSQVFTLKLLGYLPNHWLGDNQFKTSSFLKVRRSTQAIKTSSPSIAVILIPSLSVSTLIIALFVGVWYYVKVVRTKEMDEDHSQLIKIDTVIRFSFEAIRLATQNFEHKLGHGGFGSVFEGTLEDGTKVAVKRLDSARQGTKEFLAEVNTIGTLHHYNLVKLIGYCDDGPKRLLVYQFMQNGSLDKWIYDPNLAQTLTWNLRQRIINGIAKGLEYLHENCLQNVIHFDIKPQNILLDYDFNVKISDFGLAKMVDRDQSHVMTIIRGTPGYMAPELITAQVISVKVDVYSFGVLILEIACGRKNFDSSEDELLTNLVKIKADEDRLSDLIDERVEDMKHHHQEVVQMMKIAIWCLQPHFIRPNMSMVVKVLQNLANIDALSDLSYSTMIHENNQSNTNFISLTRPEESLLSGPR